MLRILATIAIAAAAFLASRPADACTCVKRSYAEHAKAASRVFVARAGKPIKTGDALKQTFTVLATFKGTAQRTFLFDRRATPPCASNYAEGEVAILFTTAGDLDPCHGNLPLASQTGDLAEILRATGTKTTDAKADVLEIALRGALTKYLHARPQVSIRYAPLAGTSFTVDKSKLTYAKAAAAKDIEITRAFTAGTITFVEGKYATEGLRFTLVLHFDRTWKVLSSSLIET
jgi:hypothetical protein